MSCSKIIVKTFSVTFYLIVVNQINIIVISFHETKLKILSRGLLGCDAV
jgi:hypothetical protein